MKTRTFKLQFSSGVTQAWTLPLIPMLKEDVLQIRVSSQADLIKFLGLSNIEELRQFIKNNWSLHQILNNTTVLIKGTNVSIQAPQMHKDEFLGTAKNWTKETGIFGYMKRPDNFFRIRKGDSSGRGAAWASIPTGAGDGLDFGPNNGWTGGIWLGGTYYTMATTLDNQLVSIPLQHVNSNNFDSVQIGGIGATNRWNWIYIPEGPGKDIIYADTQDDEFIYEPEEPTEPEIPGSPEDGKGGDVNIMDRYSPVLQSGGTGIYIMDDWGVRDLFKSLYTTTLSESLKKLTGAFGDDSSSILSLRWYYGIREDIDYVDKEWRYVQVGNQTLDSKSGQEVKGIIPKSEFATFRTDTIAISPKFNNYLDYEYTTYKLYIPFYGYVDLKGSDILGRRIGLKYHVDLANGDSLVFVNTYTDKYVFMNNIFTAPVQMGVEIPLQAHSKDTGLLRAVKSTATMAIGNIPGAGILATAPSQAGTSVGGGSGGIGHLGSLKPYMVIIRPVVASKDHHKVYGKPLAVVRQIGDLKGFLKTGNIVKMPACKYKDKIEEMLKEGVYL